MTRVVEEAQGALGVADVHLADAGRVQPKGPKIRDRHLQHPDEERQERIAVAHDHNRGVRIVPGDQLVDSNAHPLVQL